MSASTLLKKKESRHIVKMFWELRSQKKIQLEKQKRFSVLYFCCLWLSLPFSHIVSIFHFLIFMSPVIFSSFTFLSVCLLRFSINFCFAFFIIPPLFLQVSSFYFFFTISLLLSVSPCLLFRCSLLRPPSPTVPDIPGCNLARSGIITLWLPARVQQLRVHVRER